jgi:hypothetical protein
MGGRPLHRKIWDLSRVCVYGLASPTIFVKICYERDCHVKFGNFQNLSAFKKNKLVLIERDFGTPSD